MNKTVEQMRIHDALDLFEKYDAEIKFKNYHRCNFEEQIGKVLIAQDLLSGNNPDLTSKFKRAIELIRAELKKGTLEELITSRNEYKKQLPPEFQGYYANNTVKPIKWPKQSYGTVMSITDALDFFESYKAEISFIGTTICNLRQQVGKIVLENNLLNGENKELSSKLRRAIELVNFELKKGSLQSILEERKREKAKAKKQVPPREDDKKTTRGTSSQGRTDASSQGPKKESSSQRGNDSSRRSDYRNDGQANQNTEVSIQFVRNEKSQHNGNVVQIVEIPEGREQFEAALPNGQKITLRPPMLSQELLARGMQLQGGRPVNIKKYLIMELTPDKKRMYINMVFGNLDIPRMHKDLKYFDTCVNSSLSRNRLDNVCRNNFGVLDDVNTNAPNPLQAQIVARSVLERGIEIKTTQYTGVIGTLFGRKESKPQNILRIYKTGIMIIDGKVCTVFSYGTKDETTGADLGFGSFIVGDFDEERFNTDQAYHDAVILNVFTPSRLSNSRRAEIRYPYIGTITENGEVRNDLDILKELNKDKTKTI